MRRLPLVLLLGLWGPVAASQTLCTDGAVADDGLVFSCSGVDLYARLEAYEMGVVSDPGSTGNLGDLWGWTDPETGREYALVTGTRMAFVDVTDPNAPRPLGAVDMPGGYGSRDLKVHGHHVYSGQHGPTGITVFDLHRLRGLSADPSRRFDPDAVTEPRDVHNVVVAEGAPLMASVGGSTCEGGYAFFGLAAPAAPEPLGCYSTAPVHDAQCLVYDGPDADWTGRTVCFGFNFDHVGIIDVTDPAAVAPISDALYPTAPLTHQGWLTEDRRYLLVGDEVDEDVTGGQTRTIVLDVSDLEYLNPSTTAIDHNQYVAGGYLYQANYTAGLRVLDLERVATARLREVAFFDTYPQADTGLNRFDGAWSVYPFFESGTVLVSDQVHGLFVLRPDPSIVPVATDRPAAPSGLELVAETPARGTAAVRLTAPAGEHLRLSVYDLTGRTVGVLYDGPALGTEQVFSVGDGLPAGAVLVRAETAGGTATRRVALVR